MLILILIKFYFNKIVILKMLFFLLIQLMKKIKEKLLIYLLFNYAS